MKRFVFNLETLLQHRMNLEEKERNELARIRHSLQSEKEHGDDLRQRLRETAMELSHMQSENADSRETSWFCRYMDRVRHDIEASDKRIIQLEHSLQAQKLAVVEAIKKTKTLGSLKAKRQREYNLLSEKEGQKAIDEIVVTRFVRKNE